jgi:ABC-type Fe3+-hydroxamate transport system substrate-binding protein
VSYKQIEELKPDIILGNKEENTRKMVGELEKIAPVHLSDVDSVEGAIDLIEIYGELFQVVEKAGEIKNKILKQRKKFGKACLNKAEKPLKIAYFIWRKPWMVAASGTFIDAMIQEQGWENAFADLERYPPVKLADLPDCDRILLSSEPFPFKEKHREEIKAYFDADKIHFVDGEYFSWYGSRLSLAYPYFKILHDKITQ